MLSCVYTVKNICALLSSFLIQYNLGYKWKYPTAPVTTLLLKKIIIFLVYWPKSSQKQRYWNWDLVQTTQDKFTLNWTFLTRSTVSLSKKIIKERLITITLITIKIRQNLSWIWNKLQWKYECEIKDTEEVRANHAKAAYTEWFLKTCILLFPPPFTGTLKIWGKNVSL